MLYRRAGTSTWTLVGCSLRQNQKAPLAVTGLTHDATRQYQIQVDVLAERITSESDCTVDSPAAVQGRSGAITERTTDSIRNLWAVPVLWEGKINATWDKNNEVGTAYATGYRVRWKRLYASAWIGEADTTQNSHTITGLDDNQWYEVRVDLLERNADGDIVVKTGKGQATSLNSSATTSGPAIVIDHSRLDAGNEKVYIPFNRVGNAYNGFRVHYRPYSATNPGDWIYSSCSTSQTASLPYLQTGLTNGVEYEFRVGVALYPVPPDGTCAEADEIAERRAAYVRFTPSARVHGLTVEHFAGGNASHIEITWNKHLDASTSLLRYTVQHKATTSSGWASTHDNTGNSRHYSTGVAAGVQYDFRVELRGVGGSATQVTSACMPTNLYSRDVVATPMDGAVNLQWGGCTPYAWGYTYYKTNTPAADRPAAVIRTKNAGALIERLDNGTQYTFEVYHMMTDNPSDNLVSGRQKTFMVPRQVKVGCCRWEYERNTDGTLKLYSWTPVPGTTNTTANFSATATATPMANLANFTVSGGSPNARELVVSWTHNADAAPHGYGVSYKDYYAADYGPITRIGTDTNAAGKIEHTITGLTPGQKYTVRVERMASATGTDTMGGATSTATEAPATGILGLTATVASQSVTLNWDAHPDASDTLRYDVDYKLSSASAYTDHSVQPDTSTSATIGGLTNGQGYDFRVQLCKRPRSSCTEYIESSIATIRATPAAAVTNLAASSHDGELRLSWDANDHARNGYVVTYWKRGQSVNSNEYYSSVADGTARVSGTSHTITGVENGETYRVEVGLAASGTEVVRGTEARVEARPLAMITGLTLAPGATEITFKWDAHPQAQFYGVSYKETSAANFGDRDVFLAADVTDPSEFTGLTVNTDYTVRVELCADSRCTTIIEGPTVTTTTRTIPAITGLRAVGGDGTLTLTWDPFGNSTNGYGVSYKLQSAQNFGSITRTDAGVFGTTYTITGLTNGATYDVRVDHMSAATGTGVTAAHRATTTGTPSDLGALTVTTPDFGQLTATWPANPNADHGYGVSYKLSGATNYGSIRRVSGTSYTIRGLTNDETYSVRVERMASASGTAVVDGSAVSGLGTVAGKIRVETIASTDCQFVVTLERHPLARATGTMYVLRYKLPSDGAYVRANMDSLTETVRVARVGEFTLQVELMGDGGLTRSAATTSTTAPVLECGEQSLGENGNTVVGQSGDQSGSGNENPGGPPESNEPSTDAPTLTLTAGEETITASWTAVDDAPHGYAIRWRESGGTYNAAERRTTTFKSIIRLTAGQEYEVRVDVLANDTAPYQFVANRHVTAKATPTEASEEGAVGGSDDPPAPSVQSVSVTSNAGSDNTYERGDTITVKVAFDQAVAVTGTPTVKIKMDPSYGVKTASYASGSGTASLSFSYTVVTPNLSTSGIAIVANSLSGGTIKSGDQDATRTFSGVAHNASHKIDWRLPAPAVTGISITSDPGDDDTYGLGDTLRFAVTFDEKVYVTGDPELRIMMDPNYGRDWRADYASGSGTQTLTFEHTVVEPNCSPTGIAVSENPVILDSNDRIEIHQQHRGNFTFTHAGLGHNAGHKLAWDASCGE